MREVSLRTGLYLVSFSLLPSMLGRVAWSQEPVQVERITLPEIVWNTNVASIKMRNPLPRLRTVIVNVQARNHRGTGWETEHALLGGETTVVDREILMPPFPGKANVVITIREKDGPEIYRREFATEFGLENNRIGKLHLPSWWFAQSPYKERSLAFEYPRLELARRGHFVFYYPQNFMYVQNHLNALAHARARTYKSLRRLLNPTFHDDVAVYLFPDEVTKYAYTGHQGMGWAFDHVLVEVFDVEHPKNPDRIDPNHELVHIMMEPLGNPPAIFSEGLAAYLQVHHRWADYPVDDWARSFDAAGMLMPLADLFALGEIGPKGTQAWVTYPESASMIQYLRNRFGLTKVLEAYRELKSGTPEQQNAVAFQRIFGIGLDVFERGWRSHLERKTTRVPEQMVEGIRTKIAKDQN